MTVPIDLQSQLPPPSDDEPQELRSDIVDELADHLQCLVIKEQLKAGGDGLTQAEVWQRVIERFGNPAKIARTLWFQAIGRRLMLQKLALGLNLCFTLVACVGGIVVFYSLQNSVTLMSDRVLQLSALLERLEANGISANKLSETAPSGASAAQPRVVDSDNWKPRWLSTGSQTELAGPPVTDFTPERYRVVIDPRFGYRDELTPVTVMLKSFAIPNPRPPGLSVIKFKLQHSRTGFGAPFRSMDEDTTSVVTVTPLNGGRVRMNAPALHDDGAFMEVPATKLRIALIEGAGRYNVTVTTEQGFKHTTSLSILPGETKDHELTWTTPRPDLAALEPAAVRFKCINLPELPDELEPKFIHVNVSSIETPSIEIDGRVWSKERDLYSVKTNDAGLSLTVDQSGNVVSMFPVMNPVMNIGAIATASKISNDDPWIFLERTKFVFNASHNGSSLNPPKGYASQGLFSVTSDRQEIILDLAETSVKAASNGPSESEVVK